VTVVTPAVFNFSLIVIPVMMVGMQSAVKLKKLPTEENTTYGTQATSEVNNLTVQTKIGPKALHILFHIQLTMLPWK
jgi:hypothetical protein